MTPAAAAARYELLEELGAGTSGTVHRARDLQLGRDVAIKLLRGELLAGPGGAEEARRLQREARVAAAFRHPNAVEIYEVGELAGRPFLAMELVRGAPLATLLAGLPAAAGPAVARGIGAALAEVLVAAHAAGLVHRDLKPSNIFVDGPLAAPHRVRLVDFGLAFLVAPPSASLGRLTAEGLMVGTPAYMAPEQADGRPLGPPADIYALGCLLYELISGRTPFTGNVAKIVTGHLYLPPVPLAELELAHEVPAALDAAVTAMLEKEPAARPTAGELLARLTAADAPSAPTSRSTAGASRADRCVAPGAPGAPGERTVVLPTVRFATLGLSAGDLAALATLATEGAVAAVGGEPAGVLLVALDDRGEPFVLLPPPPSLPVVGLHPAPTPALMAHAIRAGVALVERMPPRPGIVRRLAALARSHRLTGA